MAGTGSPSPEEPELHVIDSSTTGAGVAPVDLDTGDADREATAVLVALARIEGATSVRTAHPRAARRAAAVIDAIVAAGDAAQADRSGA